jgi:hypothetical protein
MTRMTSTQEYLKSILEIEKDEIKKITSNNFIFSIFRLFISLFINLFLSLIKLSKISIAQ